MDSRSQMWTASGANIIAGIWLVLAPFILNYISPAARVNDIFLGVLIAGSSLLRMLTPSVWGAWFSGASIIFGLWLIVAPFILNYAGEAAPLSNNIIIGILVTALAIWSTYAAIQPKLTRYTTGFAKGGRREVEEEEEEEKDDENRPLTY